MQSRLNVLAATLIIAGCGPSLVEERSIDEGEGYSKKQLRMSGTGWHEERYIDKRALEKALGEIDPPKTKEGKLIWTNKVWESQTIHMTSVACFSDPGRLDAIEYAVRNALMELLYAEERWLGDKTCRVEVKDNGEAEIKCEQQKIDVEKQSIVRYGKGFHTRVVGCVKIGARRKADLKLLIPVD